MITKFVYINLIINILKKKDTLYENYQIEYLKTKEFQITYLNNTYNMKVIQEKKEFYLYLEPYHNSYFKTKINIQDLKMKLNMTLFAVKENEEVY